MDHLLFFIFNENFGVEAELEYISIPCPTSSKTFLLKTKKFKL